MLIKGDTLSRAKIVINFCVAAFRISFSLSPKNSLLLEAALFIKHTWLFGFAKYRASIG